MATGRGEDSYACRDSSGVCGCFGIDLGIKKEDWRDEVLFLLGGLAGGVGRCALMISRLASFPVNWMQSSVGTQCDLRHTKDLEIVRYLGEEGSGG
jgi:hypothetical protein